MEVQDHRYADAAFSALERLDRANSVSGVADVLATALRTFGFEYFVMASSRIEPNNFGKMIMLDHWPVPWRMQYQHENLFPDDPVAKLAKRTPAPFRWNDVSAELESEKRVMASSSWDHGLKQGFSVPIHGISGYQATVSAAGRDVDLGSDARRAAELMMLYAYRRTVGLRTVVKRVLLTPREREVMTWAAAGKSAWDTGEILRISEQTVRSHIAAVRAKLDVRSKAQAIVESIRLGEIDP